jgi:hypothetical protein
MNRRVFLSKTAAATAGLSLSFPIVALAEGGHGNEQAHAFRLALIRDPRFPSVVNDLVGECGKARYQRAPRPL